jgi:hypothetical protein
VVTKEYIFLATKVEDLQKNLYLGNTMIVSRKKFYCLLVLSLLTLIGLYQGIWLISGKADGQIEGFGRGVGRRARGIQNVTITYAVDQNTFTENYLRNGIPDTTNRLSVRYLLFWPSISRENTLIGNWAGPFIFFIIILLIISIVFLQDGVVPFTASFQLNKRQPFVVVLNPQAETTPVTGFV